MSDWTLGIDVGTTYTVAAVALEGHSSVLDLNQTGQYHLPSAVLLEADGSVTIGTEARSQAAGAPDRFEPSPKRWIGEEKLLLGTELLPVNDLVAALLSRVLDAARRTCGEDPSRVVLTTPADWAGPRINALVDAAARAGLAPVTVIAEPIAAVFRAGAQVNVGDHVAVYDHGGTSCKAAVLVRAPRGFELAGPPASREPLGGDTLDQLILDHIGRDMSAEEAAWANLVSPPDERWRGAALALRGEACRVKESLSHQLVEHLSIPPLGREVQLTRREFEGLIEVEIEQSLETLAEAMDAAAVSVTDLSAVHLVGGCSRIPAVAEAVWRKLGRRPLVEDDPQSVIALGAAAIGLDDTALRIAKAVRFTGTDAPLAATGAFQNPNQEGAPASEEATGFPVATPAFRSMLAMATRSPDWPSGAVGSCYIDVSDGDVTVAARDEPTPLTAADELAALAEKRWHQDSGFRSMSCDPAVVLGSSNGIERRFVLNRDSGVTTMFERYLFRDGRAITVTAPEAARHVADALIYDECLLPTDRFQEMRFNVEREPDWLVHERVELLRPSTGHVVWAESHALLGPVDSVQWLRWYTERYAAGGWRVTAEGRGRVLRRPQSVGRFALLEGLPAVSQTLTRGTSQAGEVMRILATVFEGRAYTVQVVMPSLDRTEVKSLIGHVVLRLPLPGQRVYGQAGVGAFADPNF